MNNVSCVCGASLRAWAGMNRKLFPAGLYRKYEIDEREHAAAILCRFPWCPSHTIDGVPVIGLVDRPRVQVRVEFVTPLRPALAAFAGE
jgi:hypothetical protein